MWHFQPSWPNYLTICEIFESTIILSQICDKSEKKLDLHHFWQVGQNIWQIVKILEIWQIIKPPLTWNMALVGVVALSPWGWALQSCLLLFNCSFLLLSIARIQQRWKLLIGFYALYIIFSRIVNFDALFTF